MNSDTLKVVELFAGVGGFRLGLEGWNGKSASSNYKDDLPVNYEVVWSNQWEPSSKRQHANEVYSMRWPKADHFGDDINKVASVDVAPQRIKEVIPEHDLLVGGFPCQDYSVAGVNTNGMQGKKGVLWWNIHRILEVRRPKYVLLENVDRLLKSPTRARGRDFAILLATMSDLGYDVEWKVINAADYGMPQRRRRVFIMGYHRNALRFGKTINWLKDDGVLARSFPSAQKGDIESFEINGTAHQLSEEYQLGKFLNSGVMKKRKVTMFDYAPSNSIDHTYSVYHTLGDVLTGRHGISEEYYVTNSSKLRRPLVKRQRAGALLSYLETNAQCEVILKTDLDKWKYLKGKKAEERTSSMGTFYYTEGPLQLTDALNKPSRTIITSEGGPGPSRFKHLIELDAGKRYRRLTPVELERLNMFPDDHTKVANIGNTKRAFFMGNALVVGIAERIGLQLAVEVRAYRGN